MKIQVQTKTKYGNTLIYPICDRALAFASIAGKKTLSQTDIKLIKQIGIEIEELFESMIGE